MKIAVCLHLYYPGKIDSIFSYLDNITEPFKLYVNLVEDRYDRATMSKIQARYNDCIIVVSENRGVDIGGFLKTLKLVDQDTELVLKIHTKVGVGDEGTPSELVRKHGVAQASCVSIGWFEDLMRGVAGSEMQVSEILRMFRTNQNCGMVGFKLFRSMGPNLSEIQKLAPLFSLSCCNLDKVGFVGGTIFWVRYRIVRKYFPDHVIDRLIDQMSYGYALEPSINHALERIFGYLIDAEGSEICVVDPSEHLWDKDDEDFSDDKATSLLDRH